MITVPQLSTDEAELTLNVPRVHNIYLASRHHLQAILRPDGQVYTCLGQSRAIYSIPAVCLQLTSDNESTSQAPHLKLTNCLHPIPISAIWRFTIYWSLLLTGLAFFLCGTWACFIFSRRSRKHLKYAIWLPVAYIVLGGLISMVTGTVIGELPQPVLRASLRYTLY